MVKNTDIYAVLSGVEGVRKVFSIGDLVGGDDDVELPVISFSRQSSTSSPFLDGQSEARNTSFSVTVYVENPVELDALDDKIRRAFAESDLPHADIQGVSDGAESDAQELVYFRGLSILFLEQG